MSPVYIAVTIQPNPLANSVARIPRVNSVYEIRLPAEVRRLLQFFHISISLGLEAVPLACVGANGYEKRLLFWMLLPVEVVVGVVAVVGTKVLLSDCRSIKPGAVSAAPAAEGEPDFEASSSAAAATMEVAASESNRTPLIMQRLFERATPSVLQIFFLAYRALLGLDRTASGSCYPNSLPC